MLEEAPTVLMLLVLVSADDADAPAQVQPRPQDLPAYATSRAGAWAHARRRALPGLRRLALVAAARSGRSARSDARARPHPCGWQSRSCADSSSVPAPAF